MWKMAMKNQLWFAQRCNARVPFLEEAPEGVCPFILHMESVRYIQTA